MTSFMALDGVTSFLRLKDVTNTCKRMRRGLSIGGISSVQRRKVGRSCNLIKTRSTLTMSAGRSDTDPCEIIFSVARSGFNQIGRS